MGEQNHWERQRREIDSYNIFYSAFHGVNGGSTLKNLGFRSPYRFPEIPVRDQEEDAEPDIAVFNGDTLLLAEIKSGKQVSQSHFDQIKRCDNLTIEGGESWLKDAEISERGMNHNNLENIETAIVYMEDRYQNEILKYSEDIIDKIAEKAVVLSQQRGGKLSSERGSFSDTAIDSFFSNGVSLPDVPPQTVYLNEEVEKECLAVSICHDHVLRDLKNGRVKLTPSTAEDLYPNRAINVGDVIDVLNFLSEIGACRITDDEYVFEQGHQRNIFKVMDIVGRTRVDEYMDYPDKKQSSLDEYDFFEE
ncbi:hypothetical protein JZX76_11440 [Haloarcula hispanica]|uniref:Uncharacterized protein n=1 Tax=Haloarcula hispanica TaxID=51589 RepID=A0A482T813_HALHI|nr:hypothetical protein [Haloarcula hispanica]MCJ0620100.1 hypothetical protein [Haloarcula hispanica]RYJ10532.1 hypothetical protein ELS20_11370 [Haloarcula hispanica]